MKWLKELQLALLVLVCSCSFSNADTTDNILNPSGYSGNYEQCSGSGCWGGTSGGVSPSYNGYTYRWGYGNSVISQTVAIQNALSESGINVDGYQYSWRIKNGNANLYSGQSGVDTLTFTVDVYKANGDLYQSYDYVYDQFVDWTTFEGEQLFPESLPPSFFGNLSLSAESRDTGFWAGYYGPEWEAGSTFIKLIYSADPCYNNPLYDPSCDGYAEAYAQQQYDISCAANALYDSGCPGYATAYFNQQCGINALYDTACPGYAQAYFDQQCSLDSLYDSGCPGYAEAYFAQQCSLDVMYDPGCPGYDEYVLSLIPADTVAEEDHHDTTTTAATETIPVTDPEEIAMPSTTGDATVDSVLKDLTDVPTQTIVMETSPVETIAVETTTEQETETVAETDTAGEVEEIVVVESEASETEEVVEEVAATEEKEQPKKDSKREKMKKAVTERAANLANEMSQAASLEAQKAAQQAVLALINYTPGFNEYQKAMNGGYMPDAEGYPSTQLPETKRGLRNGLAQQLLHDQMVDMQYDRGN